MHLKALLLTGCAVLLLAAGCSNKRWYSESHGFADLNPEAYEQDLHACKEQAYSRFPLQGYSPAFSSGAPLYYGDGFPGRHRYWRRPPFGMMDHFSRSEFVREDNRARQEAAEALEDYNQTRRNAIRYCMRDKGWREVEMEEGAKQEAASSHSNTSL